MLPFVHKVRGIMYMTKAKPDKRVTYKEGRKQGVGRNGNQTSLKLKIPCFIVWILKSCLYFTQLKKLNQNQPAKIMTVKT